MPRLSGVVSSMVTTWSSHLARRDERDPLAIECSFAGSNFHPTLEDLAEHSQVTARLPLRRVDAEPVRFRGVFFTGVHLVGDVDGEIEAVRFYVGPTDQWCPQREISFPAWVLPLTLPVVHGSFALTDTLRVRVMTRSGSFPSFLVGLVGLVRVES